MYVAVLLACTLHQCYSMGLYSKMEFATQEKCVASFGFVATTMHPGNKTLRVECMTKKDWKSLPEFPRTAPR